MGDDSSNLLLFHRMIPGKDEPADGRTGGQAEDRTGGRVVRGVRWPDGGLASGWVVGGLQGWEACRWKLGNHDVSSESDESSS